MNSFLKITAFLLITFPFFFESFLLAQPINKKYLAILDSVKKIYGDTCSIGVNSKLIEKLYPFKNYSQVKEYLNEFKKIKKQIKEFRDAYSPTLEKENVILFSLPRIFKSKKDWNVVNAAGIYYGVDSVTNIALSYFIIKNNVSKYKISLIQIGQIDPVFKKELTRNGSDWYYSEKLKQLLIDSSSQIK